MDEKIKTSLHCFPAKEKCNMKKALFDWPIVLQYEVNNHVCKISEHVLSIKINWTLEVSTL